MKTNKAPKRKSSPAPASVPDFSPEEIAYLEKRGVDTEDEIETELIIRLREAGEEAREVFPEIIAEYTGWTERDSRAYTRTVLSLLRGLEKISGKNNPFGISGKEVSRLLDLATSGTERKALNAERKLTDLGILSGYELTREAVRIFPKETRKFLEPGSGYNPTPVPPAYLLSGGEPVIVKVFGNDGEGLDIVGPFKTEEKARAYIRRLPEAGDLSYEISSLTTPEGFRDSFRDEEED